MKFEVIAVLALALSCHASESDEYAEIEDSLIINKTCTLPHERYNHCGTACEMTCENWQPDTEACIRKCAPGCFCEEGHIRSNATGTCIPNTKCWAIVKSILNDFAGN